MRIQNPEITVRQINIRCKAIADLGGELQWDSPHNCWILSSPGGAIFHLPRRLFNTTPLSELIDTYKEFSK